MKMGPKNKQDTGSAATITEERLPEETPKMNAVDKKGETIVNEQKQDEIINEPEDVN